MSGCASMSLTVELGRVLDVLDAAAVIGTIGHGAR
jgi:hypothetical protein